MKPIFRYMGGKSWLSDRLSYHIEEAFSDDSISSYCEPFVGGMGSAIIAMETLLKLGRTDVKIFLNDINKFLVEVYETIYKGGNELDDFISDWEESIGVFNSLLPKCGGSDKKDLDSVNQYFLSIRERYNKHRNSLDLVLLQQLSFNGIYRENKKGFYNTPFGWRSKPISRREFVKSVVELKELMSNFDITFTSGDYADVIDKSDCLYYLDPPYVNTDGTKESSYSTDGFSYMEQDKLIDKISDKKFLYSNHYSDSIISKFRGEFDVHSFYRKNIVSSGDRSKDKREMLVYNY